jgi:serine phosphatase RsbU (regulator of sigma subunit)
MKAGAMDYLSKNDFSAETLDSAIRTSVDKASRQRQRTESRERLQRYRYEKEKRRELEASLELARDIQQSLLPSAPPPLKGFDVSGVCVPAELAGGDYFDYLTMPDGTMSLVVGDVSGHGIGPALLAAETRAYLRALTRISSDVARVTTTVNRLLWEDTSGERFAALCMARIDTATRTMVYAGAGQVSYIVHSTGEFTTLASTAPPLGVFDRTLVSTVGPIALNPGDILFMATDGLVDAHSPDQRMFGKERAIGLIHAYRSNPAEKIVDALLHALRTFVQQQPPLDDVTILLAKVADAPANVID